MQDYLPPAAECLCHNAGICCCVLHGLSKRRLIRSMAGRPDDGHGPRWVSCVTNKQGGPKTALMHGAGAIGCYEQCAVCTFLIRRSRFRISRPST